MATGDAEVVADEIANGAPNGRDVERTVDARASGAPSGEETNVDSSPSSGGSRLCPSDFRCRLPSDSGSGNPSSWLSGAPRAWVV